LIVRQIIQGLIWWLLQKGYISFIFNLFSFPLYTQLEQHNSMLKNSKKIMTIKNLINLSSLPIQSTFKHSHFTIKHGAWRWSLTLITLFAHMPTRHHFRLFWTVLLKEILGFLVFGFNKKNKGLEFFELRKNVTTHYWKKFLGILECRLKIVKLGFQFYIFVV